MRLKRQESHRIDAGFSKVLEGERSGQLEEGRGNILGLAQIEKLLQQRERWERGGSSGTTRGEGHANRRARDDARNNS